MELLDTVLRTCKAGDYVDNFVQNDVDISNLQLLNDEDLKIIGIDESNIRENIIKKAKELQIPLEKKINITVDKDYALQVLYQIKNQLHLNNINLLYGLAREDIIICDNQMYNAAKCLENCVNSFDNTIKEFERKVGVIHAKKSKRKTFMLFVSSATFLLICAKLYCSCNK